MSGEGKGYTFRRTRKTSRSTKELHEEFNKIFFTECPLREYVKIGHGVELIQHGDDHVWARDLVLKGMFEFSISLHEGWQEDWEYLEDENREDSFLSLSKKFAEENGLQFFENYIFGRIYHKGDFYNINPDDKNIDKIVELWLNDDRQAIVDIMEMPRMQQKLYEKLG